MEDYIKKLDRQYPVILWRLLHRYEKYEDLSTDYDEVRKTILIYDGCNDDGTIPKW